jgi:hypothetical protein
MLRKPHTTQRLSVVQDHGGVGLPRDTRYEFFLIPDPDSWVKKAWKNCIAKFL